MRFEGDAFVSRLQLEVDGGSQVGRGLEHRWQREDLVLRLSLHSGKPRLRVDKLGGSVQPFLIFQAGISRAAPSH